MPSERTLPKKRNPLLNADKAPPRMRNTQIPTPKSLSHD